MATVLTGAPAQTVDAEQAAPVRAVETPVVPVIRSQTSTSAGASASVVLVWLWQILAPRFQLPEMPTEVAMVLAIYATDLMRSLLSRGHPS